MKNSINKLFARKSAAKPEKTSAQLVVDAAVNAAFKYAGLKADRRTLISAKLINDATGSWCAVTFYDESTACRMNYTAYVDIYSNDVCGFSGEADKTWIDYPAQCSADIERIYVYPTLAIAV